MASDKIMQLQLLQQNLQQFMMQRQQSQQELLEIDAALKELPSSPQVYKIVGKLMLAQDKDFLSKELEDKKKVLNLRLQSLDDQEEKLKASISSLQKEVMEGMKQEE